MSHFQIPNGLGALSGMAQLLLYFIYWNATPVVAQQLEGCEEGTPTKTQLWKGTTQQKTPSHCATPQPWDVHIQSASNLLDSDE